MRGSLAALSLWALLALLVLPALLVGCEEPTYFSRSCGGEAVLVCPPYGYAIVEEASFGPSGLAPGDFADQAEITATISTCGREPEGAPFYVSVVALVPGPSDAPQLIPVIDLADDGGETDEVAGDGRIDAVVTNPFERIIPEDADIELRFEPRLGSECRGQTLAIEYQTGHLMM